MPGCRFLLRAMVAGVLAFAVSACETRVGLDGGTGGGGFPTGTGTIQSALVGEWSLILINRDAAGALVSSSETRWRFDQDGTVTRTSIATSFLSGFQDVVRTTGRWSATPSTVTIELANSPVLPLSWRIESSVSGPVLVLGTLHFLRR